ncbi:MAG: tetratricopeptide repeat protein, partial [Pirellulales bacterium]|nr:tetratricopeptide repeat protein [Pirellulales bacterium]
MAQGLQFDLKQLVLFNGTFGPVEINQINDAMSSGYPQYRILREAVSELEEKEDQSPASMVRLGVCLHLLGRFRQAIEALSNADGGALAQFYMGRSHFALQRYDEALEKYSAAQTAGYNADECALAKAEALRCSGDARAALEILDNLSGAIEQTAECLYQRGATIAALGGNPEEVIRLFERAVEADGSHSGALFGLAL